MRYDYNQITRLNATILVIGPEDRETFTTYWQRENYPFVGLPDPQHRVAERYRQEVNLNKLGRMPALFVIDRQGKIQYRHYGDSLRDLAPNEDIMALLRRLNNGSDENL